MRDRILPLLIISLYLAYFLVFIVGGPRAESAYRGPTGETVSEEEAYAAIENEDPMADLEAIQNQRVHEVHWRPGLLAQLLVINRAEAAIQDELLESDARPEQLLRHLERSKTGLLFALGLGVFWCVGLVLSILALLRSHWFARPMVLYTLTPSMLFVLTYLLTIQRERLHLMGGNPYLLTGVMVETILFFLGALVIVRLLLPAAAVEKLDDRFMSHQFLTSEPAGRRIRNFLRATGQIIVIGAVGLVVSNILLLPLFSMQLYFPEIFTALIVFGILVLIVFYTTAYVRVSRKDDYKPDYFSGLAFLGFRILKNVAFNLSALVLVGIIISMILLAAMFNINVLETFNLLEKPAKL